MVFETLLIATIIGVLLAILPAFFLFLYIARRNAMLWVTAILGGVFWLVALLARSPLLAIFQLLPYIMPPEWYPILIVVSILMAAFLAGLFEEGIKYLFLRRAPEFIETKEHALSWGLGWGLSEAILLYVMTVLLFWLFLPFLPSLPYPEFFYIHFRLMGALERNFAIIFHVSATILVALAIWHGKRLWVWLAIFFHFLFNFLPIMIAQYILMPLFGVTLEIYWIIEVLFAIMAVIFAICAYSAWKRLGGPLETQLEE